MEERRRLAAVAAKGSPFAIVDEAVVKVQAEEAPPPVTGPTLGEVTDAYWNVYAPSRLKATSQCSYRAMCRTHLVPRIGHKPITAINAAVAREFDADLAKDGVGRPSRRQTQCVLRSIVCRFAVEAGYLTEAPRMPKLLPKSNKIPQVLTAEQAMQVIEAAEWPQHRLALLLAFHGGLRSCEIRGLRVCDVDLEARVLRVRQAVSYGIVDTPKSGHDREIPLTDMLHEALAEAMAGRPPEALSALSTRGEPWGQCGLRELFQRLAKRVGITGSTVHHLRHGFVSELLDHGVGAHIVKELAGHADLNTTERYAHARLKNMREAIGVLGGLGGKGKPKP